nr:hypothetical protein [Caproiciproducens galactitolivorans]
MVNGFDTGLSTALQTNLRLPPSAPLDSAADRKERQLKSHSAHHAKYDLLSQIRRRHYKQAVHKYPNLLQRIFEQSLPNHFWVTDITYIPTVKGMLYLCAVVNLCGKMVLAYRIGVMI